MGRKKMAKPDFWNLEWYVQQKDEGLHDWEIAVDADIPLATFNKWKKEFNLPKWKYTRSYAGNFKPVTEDKKYI